MSSPQRFWDRIAARYAKSPIKDEAAYEHKLALTRQYLTSSSSLLEVGCGTGGTAVRHAPYVSRIRATDLSENMITIARERAAQTGVDNVRFERTGLEELSGERESFDVVLALSLLHLLEDRDEGIRRIRGLLKPDGLFVSNTVCLADGYSIFRYLGPPGRALGLLPLIRVFSEGQLLTSIRDGGFVIEEHWKPAASGARGVFIIARRED